MGSQSHTRATNTHTYTLEATKPSSQNTRQVLKDFVDIRYLPEPQFLDIKYADVLKDGKELNNSLDCKNPIFLLKTKFHSPKILQHWTSPLISNPVQSKTKSGF